MSQEKFQGSDRAEALRETLTAVLELGEPPHERITSLLEKVAPEDVAAVLGDFTGEQKRLVFESLPDNEVRGAVIEATDPQSAREILEDLDDQQLSDVLGELPVDDLVDQLEALPDEGRVARVIAALEEQDAKDVRELRKYAPDTAGGMMNTEFISIPSDITSREALEAIQGNLALEVIGYVYVLERNAGLSGVASIRGILAAKPETPVTAYMTRDPVTVTVGADQEEAAALVDKYNFSALPVVDEAGRMKGVITYDDVIDVVQEENSEDMLRMAGTVAVHPFHESVWAGVIKRLPFLLLTMVGGLGIIVVQRHFSDRIPAELFVSAALVVPLLIGIAGNVAIVTSTVVVRGLATGEITATRLWRALGKEILTGSLIGVILSLVVVVALTALMSFLGEPPSTTEPIAAESVSVHFRWVAALALCASVVFSTFVGGIVPVLCKLTGIIDPAIASGPFVTMVCDLSVSFIFLALVFTILCS